MKSNIPVLAAVALISMLAGAGLFKYLQPEPGGAQQSSPPNPVALHAVPLVDLEDRHSLVGDWRGQLIIVNFWAPWCAPCRREIPALIEIHQEYAKRGVTILGIAFDSREQVLRFANDYQIEYPLFITGNRGAMYNAAFGNPSGALPFTALLDRELRIIYQHNGELDAHRLRAQLDQAF